MKKIYLAIAYTGNEEESFKTANRVAGDLMKAGHCVYSPISQNHPIAAEVNLPTTWAFWEKLDRHFIEWCDSLFIVSLRGWGNSTGVQAEIKIARELGKEIKIISHRTRSVIPYNHF